MTSASGWGDCHRARTRLRRPRTAVFDARHSAVRRSMPAARARAAICCRSRVAIPRPRQWSATATATSAVEDCCSRIYRAIPTTAPSGVTADQALVVAVVNLGELPACPVIQHCDAAEEAGMPRLWPRVPRTTRRSPRHPRWPAARRATVKPSRRITRSSADAAAPADPAIVGTARGIRVLIAHPLILRGTSTGVYR